MSYKDMKKLAAGIDKELRTDYPSFEEDSLVPA